MERLTRALYAIEEAAGFDVEERGGALHLNFEEPPGTFVIAPNSSARQIWISALSTSFKLDWSESYTDFVLARAASLCCRWCAPVHPADRQCRGAELGNPQFLDPHIQAGGCGARLLAPFHGAIRYCAGARAERRRRQPCVRARG